MINLSMRFNAIPINIQSMIILYGRFLPIVQLPIFHYQLLVVN